MIVNSPRDAPSPAGADAQDDATDPVDALHDAQLLHMLQSKRLVEVPSSAEASAPLQLDQADCFAQSSPGIPPGREREQSERVDASRWIK